MRGIYPDREETLVVGEKTYRLRFGMRELARAETFLGMKALAANGVNEILSKLMNESLDGFLLMLRLQLERNHEGITYDEVYDIADADLAAAQAAVYNVLNLSLPRPDPNVPPAATETPTTSPAETTGA